jgi:hypothetical protein
MNELHHARHRRAALLRDWNRVRDVVEVSVGDEDRIEGAGVLQVVGTRRVVL